MDAEVEIDLKSQVVGTEKLFYSPQNDTVKEAKYTDQPFPNRVVWKRSPKRPEVRAAKISRMLACVPI